MTPERLLEHFDRVSEAPDAVPRLRRFILDLAVRGKLVEQDPNNEPASELFRRIQKERDAALRKTGKSRSPAPADEEDVPFEVPATWRWVRVSEVADARLGKMLDKAKNKGTPRRYLRNVNVRWFDFDISDLLEMKLEDSELGEFSLRAGDVLICEGGEPGRAAVWDEREKDIYFQKAIHRVRLFGSIVPIYFVRALYEAVVSGRLAQFLTGVTIKHFTGKELARYVFPLPPLAEQHRIVAKVDELMALSDRLEAAQAEREKRRDRLAAASLHRLNNGTDTHAFREDARFHLDHLPRLATRPEHVQQLRQTILNLAVRGKLVEQDPDDEPAAELFRRIHGWWISSISEKRVRPPRKALSVLDTSETPYDLPAGWSWARLGELIYIHSGSGLTAESMIRGPVPVFGGNGVTGYHNAANVDEETIVIGRVGYHCGSVHLTPSNAWVTDNAFITDFCSEAIWRDFLVLLLRATNLKERESATAQPVISGSKIYPIVVGLPPLAEQHRIVAKVDELMALCDRLETALTTADSESRRLLEAVLHEALQEKGARDASKKFLPSSPPRKRGSTARSLDSRVRGNDEGTRG